MTGKRAKATLRLMRAKARAAARKCLGGAVYAAGACWWCAYGVTYTAFGLAFAGAALVVTTLVAAVCFLLSGE